jgi:hypothetical protein
MVSEERSHKYWRRARGASLAVAGLIICGLAPAASTSGASGCSPHWQMFADRRIPSLSGVFALTHADVWAVGGAEGGYSSPVVFRPVIVHWDGHTIGIERFRWKKAALAGISGTGPADIWAVGTIRGQPLIVHWDGRSWRRAAVPRRRIGSGWLADVTAVSPTNAWAVGGGGLGYRPLIMHWNGVRWRALDLRAVAPSDAVLNSIDSDHRGRVWAAGADYQHAPVSFGFTDLVMRVEHGRWQQVDSPLERKAGSGPMADALAIGLSGDVWTANSDFSGNGPYFIRWPNGNAADGAESDALNLQPNIYDLAAVSPADAWAVGDLDYRQIHHNIVHAQSPLVLHWDGRRWRVQPTPFQHLKNLALAGIDAVSANDIWAVGHHVIVRYSC